MPTPPLTSIDAGTSTVFDLIAEKCDAVPISLSIADPNLDDMPLVYVNRAFTILTGYSKEAALGRNCRFLQGEGSESVDIEYLRTGIAREGNVNCCLLNYKADGTPFHNMLFVSTVTFGNGRRYLVGSQFEFAAKFLPHTLQTHPGQQTGVENDFLQSRNMHGQSMISALEMQAQGAIMMVQSYIRLHHLRTLSGGGDGDGEALKPDA